MKIHQHAAGSLVAQHARGLLQQALGGGQIAAGGGGEELLVRHRLPHQVGQPAGQRVIVETLVARLAVQSLDPVQKLRRLQEKRDGQLNRAVEIQGGALGLEDADDLVDLVAGQRAPERAGAKAGDERAPACLFLGGAGRLATGDCRQ